MFVMVSPVPRASTGMAVVVAKDVLAGLMARMVRVADCPRLFAVPPSPNFKVFRDVKDNVVVTENIPRNLASFRGCFDT